MVRDDRGVDRVQRVLVAAPVGAVAGIGAVVVQSMLAVVPCRDGGLGCVGLLVLAILLYPLLVWLLGWLMLRRLRIARPVVVASVGTALGIAAVFTFLGYGLIALVFAPTVGFLSAAAVIGTVDRWLSRPGDGSPGERRFVGR